MPKHLTAESAHAVAAKAHPEARLAYVRHAIQEAAQQGLCHKTFWPERIGHQALAHSVLDALRADGFKVSHRDLGAVEVHWPEPAAAE